MEKPASSQSLKTLREGGLSAACGGLHQEPPLSCHQSSLQAAPRYIRKAELKSAVSVDEDERKREAFQIRQCQLE
ncbi:hypothetical protein FQN60_008405 [Etheostoma spectabile]|uniref:Uncharacterized protein n=1 Tax=Etheostoma spectabile TaxID=54343 RepID=A0A5J5CVM8_9PERO|nr:hypothetical protein FQN60_008405 [Etheostoma spectabile]